MSESTNKPVIFLAFANDRDDTVGYLRNLPDEARRLRAVLEPAEQAGLCEVVVRSNSTAADIFKVFQDWKYRNRIGIFHYGGHANGYQLLLESAAGQSASADAGGLAAFLAQQQGLQLVFLNGCSTLQQTQALLDANISAVISTSRSIDDRVATDFSCQFYQGLAGGAGLQKAFDEAAAVVETTQGKDTRALYLGDASKITGTFDADRLPWLISYREGMEHVASWNLPNAVDDPLFGLPPLPQQDLPESPYRHLNRFTHQDADVYFGRGHQIRALYDRLTAPRTAPIMLFYGQSGVGKSSILDAGLIPRLEQDYEVRYLRRTAGGLLDTLQLAFLPEASGVPIETAWRAKEEQTGKPLIVFLDQLEELYTRPIADLPDELHQLLEVVKATFVTAERRPRGKLVLGFRKEWLAELEAQLAASELPRSKVFLEPLDRRGIIEVVQGPARSERLRERYGLTVEDGLAEIIADDLLADRDSAIAPTLQVLLTKMWTKASEANYEHPQFSRDLYHDLKRDGILLRDFLNQQIAAFRERYPEAVDSGLLLDIVALHTTPLGTADQRTVEQLHEQYAHLDATLPELLQQCQDLHLLTVATSAQKESTKTTRLAHDTLAPLVREQFDESDKPGQRARRILDNRAVDWEGDSDGTPLDAADLAIVEHGANGTRSLSSTEQRLLQASRELRARLQRTRKILKVAAAIAATLIVVAAAIAVKQRADAVVAKGKAERNFDRAIEAVDTLLTQVGTEALQDVAGVEEVKTTLLEKAQELSKQFEAENPTDEKGRLRTALAHRRVGDAYRVLAGDRSKNYREEAEEAYEKAIRRLQQLTATYPDQPRYRHELAEAYNWRGELWREANDSETNSKAVEHYLDALHLQEDLVKEFRDDPTYWCELARTHNNLGVVYGNMNRPELVEQAYTLVIAMLDPRWQSQSTDEFGMYLRELRKELPDSVNFQDYLKLVGLDQRPAVSNTNRLKSQVLFWSYNNRGLRNNRAFSLRKADLDRAIKESAELVKTTPSQNYRLMLAYGFNNLANLLNDEGLFKEAAAKNEQAVELFEELAAATPFIRNELANGYHSRAVVLKKLSAKGGDQKQLRTDAAQHYDMAHEGFENLFKEDKQNAQKIDRLAMSIVNMAELQLALADYAFLEQADRIPELKDHDRNFASHDKTAEAVMQLKVLDGANVDPYWREVAAAITARCVMLAQNDGTPERAVQWYVELGTKQLELAIQKGFELTPNDKRFEPLRELAPDAFRKLLAPAN